MIMMTAAKRGCCSTYGKYVVVSFRFSSATNSINNISNCLIHRHYCQRPKQRSQPRAEHPHGPWHSEPRHSAARSSLLDCRGTLHGSGFWEYPRTEYILSSPHLPPKSTKKLRSALRQGNNTDNDCSVPTPASCCPSLARHLVFVPRNSLAMKGMAGIAIEGSYRTISSAISGRASSMISGPHCDARSDVAFNPHAFSAPGRGCGWVSHQLCHPITYFLVIPRSMLP
ncbi:hypothetical protein BJ875DRAFT_286795 [Amylocarpus encephaloides]|uniref:Uncharacterized protein n=1 Tax=Amylocarpus encephaloides TaxID=45428 RepID=A0A9P8C9K4_9HELO|nr:hypothetical protein BJ875DRAFT_286795 [Amylocarpus encephaloides]